MIVATRSGDGSEYPHRAVFLQEIGSVRAGEVTKISWRLWFPSIPSREDTVRRRATHALAGTEGCASHKRGPVCPALSLAKLSPATESLIAAPRVGEAGSQKLLSGSGIWAI